MPKRASDKIITHRIELGSFERKEIKETLDIAQGIGKNAQRLSYVPSIVLPVAAVGGGLALFFGLGMIAKGLGYAGDILDDTKEVVSKYVFGEESYDDGQGSEYTGSIYRDPDTNEIINPFHGSFAGGLFGFGMKIGAKHPAFQEYQRQRREEREQQEYEAQLEQDKILSDPTFNANILFQFYRTQLARKKQAAITAGIQNDPRVRNFIVEYVLRFQQMAGGAAYMLECFNDYYEYTGERLQI